MPGPGRAAKPLRRWATVPELRPPATVRPATVLVPATSLIGRPASCGLRGACLGPPAIRAGWVGHPALPRPPGPPESVGGARRPRADLWPPLRGPRVGFAAPPPPPPVPGGVRGVAAGPPAHRRPPVPASAPPPPSASASMPRGVGPPRSRVGSRVPPRRAGPPVPASAAARPRPVAPPPPDRPRCHAASARLGPGPSPAFHRAAPACPFRAGPPPARARARRRPGRPPGLQAGRAAAFSGPPPCGRHV